MIFQNIGWKNTDNKKMERIRRGYDDIYREMKMDRIMRMRVIAMGRGLNTVMNSYDGNRE